MSLYPPINGVQPNWSGKGFELGDQIVSVLSYGENESGWNDQLTLMHEETAGSEHFIDLASRDHAINELQNHLLEQNQPTIMDIGCSSGFLIRAIRKDFPRAFVIGSDAVLGPLLRLASELPDVPILHFDLNKCPLPDNCLDGVTLLNVLEHIKDDQAALQQVFRLLKPGGICVIEVPSGPGLFDSYDRWLMHYRRYRLSDLGRLSLSVGFEIINRSHLGVFLFPGFWLVKKINRLVEKNLPARSIDDKIERDRGVIKREIQNTGHQSILRWLIHQELSLGKSISYPFGIRCLLTVRKPYNS